MPKHVFVFFFFNDTATTEIYTLSLHDALPILFCIIARTNTMTPSAAIRAVARLTFRPLLVAPALLTVPLRDRKSTRLNSSHANISYAVFCLKKKKNYKTLTIY